MSDERDFDRASSAAAVYPVKQPGYRRPRREQAISLARDPETLGSISELDLYSPEEWKPRSLIPIPAALRTSPEAGLR